MSYNSIGLDIQKSERIAAKLNDLLANFQVYYQNLRGIHWNIRGRRFFQLHVKFEELYTETNQQVDDLAERILTLGATPLHRLQDYVEVAEIKVGHNIKEDEKAVKLIVESLGTLLKIERSILELSGEANDEGTNAMMSDLITQQEKTIWMMEAWLGESV